MMLAVTCTRTHVFVDFANPFIACRGCGEFVPSFHDHERCGCGDARVDRHWCGSLDFLSVCPSWGPVDGCTCAAQFGRVGHREPAEGTAG